MNGISSAKAVSTGSNGTACALLSGGTVRCWGDGVFGELGNGTNKSSSMPVAVKGISTAKALSSGGGTTCALLSGGTVKCWGVGYGGALGDGANTNHSTPVAVRFRPSTRRP